MENRKKVMESFETSSHYEDTTLVVTLTALDKNDEPTFAITCTADIDLSPRDAIANDDTAIATFTLNDFTLCLHDDDLYKLMGLNFERGYYECRPLAKKARQIVSDLADDLWNGDNETDTEDIKILLECFVTQYMGYFSLDMILDYFIR